MLLKQLMIQPMLYTASLGSTNADTRGDYWMFKKEKTLQSGDAYAGILRIPLGDNFLPPVDTVFNTNSYPSTDTGISYDYKFTRDKSTFGYDYQYGLPYDCVRVLAITKESREQLRYQADYIVESQKIHANCDKGFVLYDAIPREYEMDSLFRNAFVHLLAHYLAVPVTGNKNLAITLRQELDNIIMPEARRINGFEAKVEPTVDSEWLEATYTSSGIYSNSTPPFGKSSYGSFE